MKKIILIAFLFSGTLVAPVIVHSQGNSSLQFGSLLETARKASRDRQWKESVEHWQKIVAMNPVNGEYVLQLGNAAYFLGKYDIAIDAYTKQIELGHGRLYDAAYNIACCYALKGEKEKALMWLKKAFSLGFSNFTHAQTDTDLLSLHGDPVFENTVGRIDPSKVDRKTGWSFDLDLLQREIDRKAVKAGQFDPVAVRNEINELKSKINSLTDNEIILETIRIMRTMNDGHSWAMPPFENPDFKKTLPLRFYQFKEGLYIIAGHPDYRDIIGAQVLSYSGIPVTRFPEIFDPYIPRDNSYGPVARIPYLMRIPAGLKTRKLIPDDNQVELKIQDLKGNIRNVVVKTDTLTPIIWNTLPSPEGWINYHETVQTPAPLYLKKMNVFHWWELLPDKKTVYCQINRIRDAKDQTFSEMAQRLFKFIDSSGADKLIIDLRWNNGGNTMLVQPFINAISQHPSINQEGKLFVIIGRRTFSAAQNTATFLEKYTRATFVGEPSGASPNFIGEEKPLILPYSKMPVNVSDLFWQSSWPFDYRPWIAPTIYTPPTFEYYKVNRDPALEAIGQYINPKKGF